MPLVPAPPLADPLPAGARDCGAPAASLASGVTDEAPVVRSGGFGGGPGGAWTGALPPAEGDGLGAALAPALVPGDAPVRGVGVLPASQALRDMANNRVAPMARQPCRAGDGCCVDDDSTGEHCAEEDSMMNSIERVAGSCRVDWACHARPVVVRSRASHVPVGEDRRKMTTPNQLAIDDA